MNLIKAESSFTIPECVDDFDGDVISCFNSANSAKYLKAPMFII